MNQFDCFILTIWLESIIFIGLFIGDQFSKSVEKLVNKEKLNATL
jgi:hypothetical protein